MIHFKKRPIQQWHQCIICWSVHMMTLSNETLSALLGFCAGNSPVTGEFPHKGQWCGALMFSLIWVWINDGVNNRDAGDLRCHRAPYDVTVMMRFLLPCIALLCHVIHCHMSSLRPMAFERSAWYNMLSGIHMILSSGPRLPWYQRYCCWTTNPRNANAGPI